MPIIHSRNKVDDGVNPVCVAAYVFGDYTRYIPFYVYSVLKSYPGYYVMVFVRGTVSGPENRALILVRKTLSARFEIIENYFAGVDTSGLDTVGGGDKILRWLLPQREFAGFQYVYFGDVDFLVVRETPPLLEGHIAHCKQTGLPYSNYVRPGSSRLTGLHFVNTESYYAKTTPHIDRYLSDHKLLIETGRRFQRDEEFLFHLVDESIGVVADPPALAYRPPHGFHLGCIRSGKIADGYYTGKVEGTVGHLLPPPPAELKRSLTEFFVDPLFVEMLVAVPEPGIIRLSQLMSDAPPGPKLHLIQLKQSTIEWTLVGFARSRARLLGWRHASWLRHAVALVLGGKNSRLSKRLKSLVDRSPTG